MTEQNLATTCNMNEQLQLATTCDMIEKQQGVKNNADL